MPPMDFGFAGLAPNPQFRRTVDYSAFPGAGNDIILGQACLFSLPVSPQPSAAGTDPMVATRFDGSLPASASTRTRLSNAAVHSRQSRFRSGPARNTALRPCLE